MTLLRQNWNRVEEVATGWLSPSEQTIRNVVENVYLQTSVHHDVEDETWSVC